MANDVAVTAPPGIAALPPSTTRQLGSGQVLADPSSVVKELIDNALDARAKSIFVDITANTIDSIQVKDDGHGIPADDRPLACRRYCTSKIRDFHDLKEVGGKWLGFRGEALASMAGMSKGLSITTRVEGEPVAVKLTYGQDGELTNTDRDSHPIGTTVKATHFLEYLPVRKQTAVKNSTKVLAKIRRLIQAYALARPGVRFRLHVLKASSGKGDFMYAPNANSSVEDAALKIVGKACALQCDWTALEAGDFKIHAFLPKPGADASKISGYGAFISVDSRPMSSNRGIVKRVVVMFKDRLRLSNPSVAGVKDPFISMNIICPPDSYDPNIEPAKDDVLFENDEIVLSVIDKLLLSFYPKASIEASNSEPPTFAQDICEEQNSGLDHVNAPAENQREDTSGIHQNVMEPNSDDLQWRSSMYGIDEGDLEHMQEDRPPIEEEEEGIRNAEVSNPWTIARMNAIVKPKAPTIQGPLLSPAKSIGTRASLPTSPVTFDTPRRILPLEPLTPQSSTRISTERLSQYRQPEGPQVHADSPRESAAMKEIPDKAASYREPAVSDLTQRGTMSINTPYRNLLRLDAPDRNGRKQLPQPLPNSFDEPSHNTWFGQPINGAKPSRSSRQQTQRAAQKNGSFHPLASPTRVSGVSHDIILTPQDNTDIRDFVRQNSQARGQIHSGSFASSGFTSINRPIDSNQLSSHFIFESCSQHQPSRYSQDMEDRFLQYTEGEGRPLQNSLVTPAQLSLPQTRLDSSASPNRTAIKNDTIAISQGYGVEGFHEITRQQSEESAPTNQLSRKIDLKADEMEAQFRAHCGASGISRKHQPRRRRTTDGAKRRKSLRCRLDNVPQREQMQHVAISLTTSIISIKQSCQKLDMSCNSLTWDPASREYHVAIAGMVTGERVMNWVKQIDNVLHRRCERVLGVDVRSLLHEGIQRALDARDNIGTPVPQALILKAQKKVGEWMSEFDVSQFVHLDDDTIGEEPLNQSQAALPMAELNGAAEDDMLMDV